MSDFLNPPESIDLCKLDQADGAAARRRIAFYGAIVNAATALPRAHAIETPIPCPRRPRGKPCAGHLVVRRQDIPSMVHWKCSACETRGTIEGWRGSIWDHSRHPNVDQPENLAESGEILLTEREWRFLKEQVITSGVEVDRIIDGARLTPRGVVLEGTFEDLEELAGNVAFVANRSRPGFRLRMCESILDRLDEVLGPGEHPSMAGQQSILTEALQAYNRTPQSELGGLSPEQAFALLHSDWKGERSPVRIARDFALSDLCGCALLANARLFLAALAERNGTRATNAGNLNRAFVEHMFASMIVPDEMREALLRFAKRFNEEDVWQLHLVRILLDVCGLIRRRKGMFRATKEGARLLTEGQAGELYARLFVGHFQRLNLAYLDRMLAEWGSLQQTIAYTLWRLADAGREWRTAEELAELVLLPSVQAEIPVGESIDVRPYMLSSRVLGPLESFGLLESLGLTDSVVRTPPRYRKTPLYDRFLTFRLE